jgi:hypothetical protein
MAFKTIPVVAKMSSAAISMIQNLFQRTWGDYWTETKIVSYPEQS